MSYTLEITEAGANPEWSQYSRLKTETLEDMKQLIESGRKESAAERACIAMCLGLVSSMTNTPKLECCSQWHAGGQKLSLTRQSDAHATFTREALELMRKQMEDGDDWKAND